MGTPQRLAGNVGTPNEAMQESQALLLAEEAKEGKPSTATVRGADGHYRVTYAGK